MKRRNKIMEQKQINQVEKIRASYTEKQQTELDQLKELNKKVKTKPAIFSYVFGSISSLVLGTGMSLAMKVIGAQLSFAMPLGIVVGVLGILGVSVNYSIYKMMLAHRKAKYAPEILAMTDKILNNEQ